MVDARRTRRYAPGVGEVKVKTGDLLIVRKPFTPARNEPACHHVSICREVW
jgi:hypothetical protein